MTPTTTLIIIIIILLIHQISTAAEIPKKFSSILVFGDSTVDPGNNNYITTLFRANYLPYGQDFPGKVPTGRFTNGKLVTDMVASFLGIKDDAVVPPFLDPDLSDDDVCSGVSFASAGSGYDDWTTVASKVIPMSAQIELFKEYITRLTGIVGEEQAAKIISDALVIVSAAPNDFIFNFYLIPARRLQFNIDEYQNFILLKIENFIKELYDLGCRRMVIAGLPPMGCLPIQMTAKLETRRCLADQNSDAEAYNRKLGSLLPQVQQQLPGSRILFADIYQPLDDMINHPSKYGFVEVKRGCCGSGRVEVWFLCNSITPTCGNASQYMFWDSIHPTEAAYHHIALYLEKELNAKLLHA